MRSAATCARLLVLVILAVATVAHASQLDDFIARPDAGYAWTVVSAERHPQGVHAVLQLTSQSWRSAAEVDRVAWRHWLEVYIPAQVVHDTALLVIGGGSNDSPAPRRPDGDLAATAVAARAVVARIHNVPNQPLVFTDDPQRRKRSEDDILAWCWDRHLVTGDPAWLVQLAMARSAVRAMDAVTAYCASGGTSVAIRHFVVAGGSKRGWTTWLAAAADRRVTAIAPMVIDLLNIEASFRHHHAAYGRYADAVRPYVENRIMERMGEPVMQASLAIIDPYAYRERLARMPKLLINATGDQFFLPDSWRFYRSGLAGPTQFRFIPNTDHGLDRSASESLRSFFIAVLAGRSLPAFTWTEEAPGRLRVETGDQPTQVLVWSAANPAARDFMVKAIGRSWRSRALEAVSPGVYVGAIPEPAQGWSAILVELVFPDPSGATPGIHLTTGVSVTPSRLPFPERP